ncbi:hypothetical protein PN462_06625 [Spirulina sp. CS-785/01]|uniref:hypothetical protein n=1 Tax=Spirulina sp. CS-785/01 TaxID=3021716 RepID=UPI00232F915D|nr:hypothetical protein [Spirulina sp. CS-785/01]MDB9312769.1 hypothetical protein [Spirulina sp. CS-785/01]
MTSLELMDKQALKELIKESIRELLQEEKMSLYTLLVPSISDEEQQDIDEQLGSPNDYADEEFVDMTDWITDGDSI